MPAAKRYASSIEVARKAGVSQSAVSRTFTEGAYVSAEMRRKVLAAANELGFRPSAIPRIMLTNRSGFIAVVIGDLQNGFYANVLEQFADRFFRAGKQIVLVPGESDYALDKIAERLSQYRVDAIVSALAVLSQEIADALSASRIPVVSFNTEVTSDYVSSVSSDNVAAGREVARKLSDRGGSRFAFVAGPRESPASQARLKGYRAGLKALGHGEPLVIPGGYSYEHGESAAARVVRSARFPDAVFCANDLVAMGFADTIRLCSGKVIGKDILLVGYDNIPAAAWRSYSLTSVDQNVSLLVDEAVRLVDAMSSKNHVAGSASLIAPKLVERRSTQGHARNRVALDD